MQQSGTDDARIVARHVGNHQGVRSPATRDPCEATALQARDAPAQGIDLPDGCARLQCPPIQSLQIRETGAGNEPVDEARGAAGNQEQHLRRGIERRHEVGGPSGRGETRLVGKDAIRT